MHDCVVRNGRMGSYGRTRALKSLHGSQEDCLPFRRMRIIASSGTGDAMCFRTITWPRQVGIKSYHNGTTKGKSQAKGHWKDGCGGFGHVKPASTFYSERHLTPKRPRLGIPLLLGGIALTGRIKEASLMLSAAQSSLQWDCTNLNTHSSTQTDRSVLLLACE